MEYQSPQRRHPLDRGHARAERREHLQPPQLLQGRQYAAERRLVHGRRQLPVLLLHAAGRPIAGREPGQRIRGRLVFELRVGEVPGELPAYRPHEPGAGVRERPRVV